MTYGEKIDEMKKTIATLYDDSEWLRDMATIEEKKFWNEFRGLAFEVDGPLRRLLNQMSQNRENTEI
jgi:hypothetical protein